MAPNYESTTTHRPCHSYDSGDQTTNRQGDSYDITCLKEVDMTVDDIHKMNQKVLGIDPKLSNTYNINKIEDIVFESETSDSVKGILEETPLSYNFFSRINKKVIQDLIKYNVYKNNIEGFRYINDQSEEQLYIIMRSILLQHGDFTIKTKKHLISHIQKLNQRVVDYSVKNILSNIQNYKKYINDKNNLPVPMDYPEQTSITDPIDYQDITIDPFDYYSNMKNTSIGKMN